MPTLAPSAAAPAAPTAAVAASAAARLNLAQLFEQAQALQDAGQADAAARLYADWIEHTASPHAHLACFNWGTVLGALNRPAEAEAAYRRALALQPGFVQAHLNLGHQLERQGRHDEAQATWQRVLDLTQPPTDATRDLRLHALNNLARLAETLRRYADAAGWLAESLALKPGQWDVIQHHVHLRQKQCQWPLYQPVPGAGLNQQLIGTSPLAMLSASDDPALQLMAAQRFVHERVPRPPAEPLHRSGPRREGRIRIGYLSGDLHMHAVGLLTAELFELHDRSRFEVHAFCWSRDDGSPLRERLLKSFDRHWRIGALDDTSAARLIAAQGIDVLVDLQGLTNGARPAILGHRAAPVQVSYLGFPGTCALPGVDWIVADPYVMPEALRPYCTEEPLYVPHCYQVSDRQRPVGRIPTRAEAGLPEQGFVYASFNNNFKFTEPVFAAWMRTLAAVHGSVLWLLADNDVARENMLSMADAHGVARERLLFAPRVAPADYLARFALADLVLDTFPYNAGTTASDCLWMGTPILTLSGRSYISRMAGSLLTAAGLPDLITTSLADYEARAVMLGREPARAASLKRYLAEHGRASRLFDVPARVRDLEDGFARLALEARTPQANQAGQPQPA